MLFTMRCAERWYYNSMKRKKRKKLPKIKTIRNKLWEATKTLVRAKYRVKGGWECYTCPTLITEPKKAHTGHLIPRVTGGLLLYYHLDALRIQCSVCNRHRGGEGAQYLYKLIQEIGMPRISMLLDQIGKVQKPTREFFQNLLDERIAMLKKLGF